MLIILRENNSLMSKYFLVCSLKIYIHWYLKVSHTIKNKNVILKTKTFKKSILLFQILVAKILYRFQSNLACMPKFTISWIRLLLKFQNWQILNNSKHFLEFLFICISCVNLYIAHSVIMFILWCYFKFYKLYNISMSFFWKNRLIYTWNKCNVNSKETILL